MKGDRNYDCIIAGSIAEHRNKETFMMAMYEKELNVQSPFDRRPIYGKIQGITNEERFVNVHEFIYHFNRTKERVLKLADF